MFTSSVPNYFWGKAIPTAAYLINRLPSKTLQFRTPINVCYRLIHRFVYSVLYNPKSSGATSVYNNSPDKSKFDSRAINCVFITILPHKKGTNVIIQCLTKSQSQVISFLENQPFYSSSSLQGKTLNEDSHQDPSITLPLSTPFEKESQRYHYHYHYLIGEQRGLT